MTPGEIQIELAESGQIEIVAEHRNEQLSEACPDIIGLGIIDGRKHRLGSLAGRIVGKAEHVIGFVRAAESSLERSAGKIEDRAVEMHALFLDDVMDAQVPLGLDVVEREGRVAPDRARIAEDVQVRNASRLGIGTEISYSSGNGPAIDG